MIIAVITYHLFVLFLCSLGLVYLERWLAARAQHRVGFKKLGVSQVIADSYKNFIKNTKDSAAKMTWFERLNMLLILICPALFYLILAMGADVDFLSSAGALVLLTILIVAALAENFFLFFQSTAGERFLFRRDQFLNFQGISIFSVCILVPMIRAGSCGLTKISESQAAPPFINAVSSPALLLSSVLSFLSLFYICGIHPISSPEKKYKEENFVYLLLFSKKLWLVSLISFWLFLFWGGAAGGVLMLPIYLLAITLTLFLIFWLEISTPAFRASYSIEIAIARLLPLALISIILEIFWRATVVVWGNH